MSPPSDALVARADAQSAFNELLGLGVVALLVGAVGVANIMIMLIGAPADLLPALRAARMSPTDALWLSDR